MRLKSLVTCEYLRHVTCQRPFVKYVNYNHMMPTRYQAPKILPLHWLHWTSAVVHSLALAYILAFESPLLLVLADYIYYTNLKHSIHHAIHSWSFPSLVCYTAVSALWTARCHQVPAEMSPGSICTDQQMDTPDGRKEARKFAKSSRALKWEGQVCESIEG